MTPASAVPRSAALNLASLIVREDAEECGALRLGERQMTLADVIDRSCRAAGRLRDKGVALGDRVALQIPNVPAFAFYYYGILRVGGIVVPINPLLRTRETAYSVTHSDAGLLIRYGPATAEDPPDDIAVMEIGDPWAEDLLGQPGDTDAAAVADNDTAVILYTSGTTGQPKGAELTHRGLRRNAQASRELYELQVGETVLGVLPLYHSYGQTCVLNSSLSAGSIVELVPRFDADQAAALIDSHAIGIVAAVPTMIQELLEISAAYDLRSLRLCQSGGAALPLAVLEKAQARFGCRVVEGYGLTETSPVATVNTREPRPDGSIGVPIAGVEVIVVGEDGGELPADEVGEIVIRGHNVMKGYWRDPAATREAIDADGWFHSGDLGRRDGDGFLYVVGRIKDMINRGGVNVYPREIEEVLHGHPDVLEAAVIAMPDGRLGEEVGAAVRLTRDGADLDDIREYVRARVAPYKYPRAIWQVDELPKGPTGKVLKRLITAPRRSAAP